MLFILAMLIKYENCQLTFTFKCLFLRLTAQSASISPSHICTIYTYEFHSPTDESYNSYQKSLWSSPSPSPPEIGGGSWPLQNSIT